MVDTDGEGSVNIEELTVFVWGTETSTRKASRKAKPKKVVTMPTEEEIAAMKKKLQSISYQAQGQDPGRLFAQYDKDK